MMLFIEKIVSVRCPNLNLSDCTIEVNNCFPMRFEKLVILVVFVLFVSCSKKSKTEVVPDVEHTISGIVSAPNGTPLKGVLVTFDYGINHQEITTGDSGQYLFKEKGNGTVSSKRGKRITDGRKKHR